MDLYYSCLLLPRVLVISGLGDSLDSMQHLHLCSINSNHSIYAIEMITLRVLVGLREQWVFNYNLLILTYLIQSDDKLRNFHLKWITKPWLPSPTSTLSIQKSISPIATPPEPLSPPRSLLNRSYSIQIRCVSYAWSALNECPIRIILLETGNYVTHRHYVDLVPFLYNNALIAAAPTHLVI